MPRSNSSSSSVVGIGGGGGTAMTVAGGMIPAMEYVNMLHIDSRGRRKEIVAMVDHYQLLYYCRKGQLKEVRDILNVKIPDFDVNTPLRNRDAKIKKIFYCLGEAASGGDLSTVRYLVNTRKADILKKDTDGWTCFNRAVYHNHINVVKFFLEKGISADCSNEDGNSGLSWACFLGLKQMVELLLSNGADINIQSPDGNTPLINAAMGGHIQVVTYLLAEGAKAHIRAETGKTALELAANGRVRQVISEHLEAKKTVESSRRTSASSSSSSSKYGQVIELDQDDDGMNESNDDDIAYGARRGRRRSSDSMRRQSRDSVDKSMHQTASSEEQTNQDDNLETKDEDEDEEDASFMKKFPKDAEEDEDFDVEELEEQEEDGESSADNSSMVRPRRRRSSPRSGGRSSRGNPSKQSQNKRSSPRLSSQSKRPSYEEDDLEDDDDEEEEYNVGRNRKRQRLVLNHDENLDDFEGVDERNTTSESKSSKSSTAQELMQHIDTMYLQLYQKAVEEKRSLESQLRDLQEATVQKEINIAKLTADLAIMDTSKKSEIDVLQRLLEEEKKKADQLHARLNVYQGDIDAIHTQLHSIEYCDIVLTKLKQTVEFVERRRIQIINNKLPKEDPSKICSLCNEHVKNIALVPCGHVVMCSNCMVGYVETKGKTCLVCNKAFEDQIRVYA